MKVTAFITSTFCLGTVLAFPQHTPSSSSTTMIPTGNPVYCSPDTEDGLWHKCRPDEVAPSMITLSASYSTIPKSTTTTNVKRSDGPEPGNVICCYPDIQDGLGCHPCRAGEVAPSMITVPATPIAPTPTVTNAARLEDNNKPKHPVGPYRPPPYVVKRAEPPSPLPPPKEPCCHIGGILPSYDCEFCLPCVASKACTYNGTNVIQPSPSKKDVASPAPTTLQGVCCLTDGTNISGCNMCANIGETFTVPAGQELWTPTQIEGNKVLFSRAETGSTDSEQTYCMMGGLLPVCNTDKEHPCGRKTERSLEARQSSLCCYREQEVFGCYPCDPPAETASNRSLVEARSEDAESQCCIYWPGRLYQCDDSLCPPGVTSTTITYALPPRAEATSVNANEDVAVRATKTISDTAPVCFGPNPQKSSTDAGYCEDGNFLTWNADDCASNCHCNSDGVLKCNHPSDCGPDSQVNAYCSANPNFQCDCPISKPEARDEPATNLVVRSEESQSIDASTLQENCECFFFDVWVCSGCKEVVTSKFTTDLAITNDNTERDVASTSDDTCDCFYFDVMICDCRHSKVISIDAATASTALTLSNVTSTKSNGITVFDIKTANVKCCWDDVLICPCGEEELASLQAKAATIDAPSNTLTTLATKVSPAKRQQTDDFHVSCAGGSQQAGRHTCKKSTIGYQDCISTCQCGNLGTMTCKAPAGSDCSDDETQQYCVGGNAYFGCGCSHVPDVPPQLVNVVPGTKDPRIPPQSWQA